jgi:hypothetical protein
MRKHPTTRRFLVRAALACALLNPWLLNGEPVRVRHTEGLVHGFLLLRTLDGKIVAEGDLTQNAGGSNVNTHLVYHFKDGSLHEETTAFSQSRTFHLLTYHLVQKGPSFQHPQDTLIDIAKREITVRYTDDDGNEKVTTDRLDFPADLANGMVLTLLKNIRPTEAPLKVSMLVATPKPLLVKLVITPAGEDAFSIGGSERKATRYEVAVEIQGIKGWFAHLMGKQPPPTRVWILYGAAPAFVKSEGPLCMDCPVWRTELASPVWPQPGPQEGESDKQQAAP